jgi:transposase
MDREVRKRLRWIELFEEVKNQTQVCLKCGISRPTLRKWVGRYQERGLDGLIAQSRRPNTSSAVRISERERKWIAELRARGLGSRRIQSELKRTYEFVVSCPTIEKVLKTLGPSIRNMYG